MRRLISNRMSYRPKGKTTTCVVAKPLIYYKELGPYRESIFWVHNTYLLIYENIQPLYIVKSFLEIWKTFYSSLKKIMKELCNIYIKVLIYRVPLMNLDILRIHLSITFGRFNVLTQSFFLLI